MTLSFRLPSISIDLTVPTNVTGVSRPALVARLKVAAPADWLTLKDGAHKPPQTIHINTGRITCTGISFSLPRAPKYAARFDAAHGETSLSRHYYYHPRQNSIIILG